MSIILLILCIPVTLAIHFHPSLGAQLTSSSNVYFKVDGLYDLDTCYHEYTSSCVSDDGNLVALAVISNPKRKITDSVYFIRRDPSDISKWTFLYSMTQSMEHQITGMHCAPQLGLLGLKIQTLKYPSESGFSIVKREKGTDKWISYPSGCDTGTTRGVIFDDDTEYKLYFNCA